MDFDLGGMQEEGESKVLLPLKRHKKSMCKSKNRGSHTRKKRESSQEGAAERKRRQPRESCTWRRKKKSKVLPPFKEIISMCMRVKKNKRDFSLTVRHTQELL